MAFKINIPPVGTTVLPSPSAAELAARSNNRLTRRRSSLNGRRLVADLNGVTLPIEKTRKAVADVYPAGTDPDIDYEQGPPAGHPAP